MKTVLSYTAPSIRLVNTIDLVISQCACVKKAVTRLKSSGHYRASSSDYFMALLLAWGDSSVIKNNILLGSKLVLGMSCPGIFRPSLAMV